MKSLLAYSLLVTTLNGIVKRSLKAGITHEELSNAWEAVMVAHQPKGPGK